MHQRGVSKILLVFYVPSSFSDAKCAANKTRLRTTALGTMPTWPLSLSGIDRLAAHIPTNELSKSRIQWDGNNCWLLFCLANQHLTFTDRVESRKSDSGKILREFVQFFWHPNRHWILLLVVQTECYILKCLNLCVWMSRLLSLWGKREREKKSERKREEERKKGRRIERERKFVRGKIYPTKKSTFLKLRRISKSWPA